MVFPHRNGVLRRTILLVAKHAEQSPTKVRITRSGYCWNQRQRRAMPMATYMQTYIIETMCTRKSRVVFMNNTFLQECQCLRSLKSRTRRIRSHNRTIQQRFPPVPLQHPMVLSTLAANHQMRIEGGRRHHAKNLSRSGFDSYDSSNLML